ncbi:MAG: PAS domain-containing protein, partial [Polaromonas sp.]|nr:PAS domain-containing protein [Polaromonas sp.]
MNIQRESDATEKDYGKLDAGQEQRVTDVQLRLMTDALPHMVWAASPDGSATYFNQKWLDYTGLPIGESMAGGWASLVHTDDSKRINALWEQALASGDALEVECRLRRADGAWRWMLCRAAAQRDESGQGKGWLGSFTDIDGLKLTSEQLEKNLAMNRIAGRVALLGGWTIDLPQRTLTWSDENCAIHDVPSGYVPTLQEGISYFLPEHRAQVIRHVDDCAEHGKPYEFILPKLTAKGRKIWVRSIGEAVRDDDGKIVRLQGAFQDITQQRAAQAHLRLLETAVSRLNDIVVILEAPEQEGATPRIVFVNDAFERHTGYTREDLFENAPPIVWVSEDHGAGLKRILADMKNWQAVRTDIAIRTKNGQERWLEIDIAPIADETGKFTHWVAVERDITERRHQQQEILGLNTQLEQRVLERTAQLATANRELESFAYSVSHDLRSPLNTIDAFSRLLLRLDAENISDKGKHYLDRIGVGARHMGELIEGLLTLWHLSRGPINAQAVDLSALALRIEEDCRTRESGHHPQLRVHAGLSAQGDARLLAAVLQNLMDNAWKFTSREPLAQIEVGSEPGADGETVFFVKDNGAGFDMTFVSKLFGTFERLHSP